MNTTIKTLDIKLLDRELRVACPEEERGELLDAVAYLDRKCAKFAMPARSPASSVSR